MFVVSRNPCSGKFHVEKAYIQICKKNACYNISSYLNVLESIQFGRYPVTHDDGDRTTIVEGSDEGEDEGVEKGEQEGPGPLGFHDLGCTGRCDRTYARRTSARMPHTTPSRRAGAAEGKNKVGVSRPRYVRACTRQREIRGHKPAYYAPPRATNTPNNGHGSARRSGRYVRSGIVLNYNNSSANYQTDWEEERKRGKRTGGPAGWLRAFRVPLRHHVAAQVRRTGGFDVC